MSVIIFCLLNSDFSLIMKNYPILIFHIDGASKGNPGRSGIGVVVKTPEGEIIETIAEYIGEATNNMAEYQALLKALDQAKKLGAQEIKVFSDSQLMVRQVKGQYQVKDAKLKILVAEVHQQLKHFKQWDLHDVPREQNAHADELASSVIPEKT